MEWLKILLATGKAEDRILFHTNDKKLIFLKSEERVSCIDFFYKRCKAESAKKLSSNDALVESIIRSVRRVS